MLLFNVTRVAGALLLAVCLGLAGCDSDDDPIGSLEAIAEIRPTHGERKRRGRRSGIRAGW